MSSYGQDKSRSHSNIYSGGSSSNVYSPSSTNSLYNAPSAANLFGASQPNNYTRPSHGQGYNQQQSGAYGTAGGSLPNLVDPEAGFDDDDMLSTGRRPSMLAVFGKELKKSWASLGNITAQAASAIMGTQGTGPVGSSGSLSNLHSSGPNSGSTDLYDEESGQHYTPSSAGSDHAIPGGGLFSYISSPSGSISLSSGDQGILPRHAARSGENARKQSLLPS
ncbi:hypothetical protein DFS34DRAFT_691200 [Phlyctochytrium arcticum]|nr:hypothetical protein DFS34DRAFT_691200 [Phlyctochytrium arcticum]